MRVTNSSQLLPNLIRLSRRQMVCEQHTMNLSLIFWMNGTWAACNMRPVWAHFYKEE